MEGFSMGISGGEIGGGRILDLPPWSAPAERQRRRRFGSSMRTPTPDAVLPFGCHRPNSPLRMGLVALQDAPKSRPFRSPGRGDPRRGSKGIRPQSPGLRVRELPWEKRSRTTFNREAVVPYRSTKRETFWFGRRGLSGRGQTPESRQGRLLIAHPIHRWVKAWPARVRSVDFSRRLTCTLALDSQ
jgi:hypothetical protein